MPTYVITGPDGKKYRVAAPEGTTPEQALERVRSAVGGAAPSTPAPAALQDASGTAIAGAPLPQPTPAPAAAPAPREQYPQLGPQDTIPRDQQGVPYDIPQVTDTRPPLPPRTPAEQEQLMAALRERERELMAGKSFSEKLNYGGAAPLRALSQTMRQFQGEDIDVDVESSRGAMQGAGGAGMLGNFLSNAALTAAPAGAGQTMLARGITKVAPRIPQWLTQALAASAVSAGLEGATNPTGYGETRAGNMVRAGATAGVMDAGMRGITRAISAPFKPNKDAEALLREGITPPLSHGTDSKIGQGIGKTSETVTTFLDSNAAPSRQRADAQTVAAMVRRATPLGKTPVSASGDIRGVAASTSDVISDEYKAVLAKKFVTVDPQFATRARRIVDTSDGDNRATKDIAHEVLAKHFRTGVRRAARNFQRKTGPNFEQDIRNLEKSTDTDKLAAAKILRKVQPLVRELRNRELGRQGVDPAVLNKLDEAWEVAKRIEDASAISEKSVGVGATELNKAVQRNATPHQFGRGEAASQDLTDVASRVIHPKERGNTLYNLAVRGGAYGAAGLAGGPVIGPLALWLAAKGVQSEPGHKMLFGQMAGQKALADFLRKGPPIGAPAYELLSGDE